MKKTLALVAAALILIGTAVPVCADQEMMYFSLVSSCELTVNQFTKNEESRALFLVAAGIDIISAGYDSYMPSGMDFYNAYMGKNEDIIMVSIPSADKKQCINAAVDPSIGLGLVQVLNGDFTSYNVRKGVNAACTMSWGFTKEMLDYMLDQVQSIMSGGSYTVYSNTSSGSSAEMTITTNDTEYVRTDNYVWNKDNFSASTERKTNIPSNLKNKKYELGTETKEVLQIKERMRELGYFSAGAELSGKYNGLMQERIRRFQKDFGIAQTGIIDEEFLETLYGEEADRKITGK